MLLYDDAAAEAVDTAPAPEPEKPKASASTEVYK